MRKWSTFVQLLQLKLNICFDATNIKVWLLELYMSAMHPGGFGFVVETLIPEIPSDSCSILSAIALCNPFLSAGFQNQDSSKSWPEIFDWDVHISCNWYLGNSSSFIVML